MGVKVVLFGPPGAGKSSVGRALAKILGTTYLDTDHVIEVESGKKIADIFVEDGEASFREHEANVVRRELDGDAEILALGGGAVLDPLTQAELSSHPALKVFLDVSLSQAGPRVGFNKDRPLLLVNPRQQWASLMERRRPIYESLADVVINTDSKKPIEVAYEIAELLRQPRTHKVPVKAEHEYEVIIGTGWAEEIDVITSNHGQVFIVAPQSVLELPLLRDLERHLNGAEVFVVPDGENQKDVATLSRIWERLGQLRFSRSDAIVGIGGGATTDLAGFAAATWLRGISWYAFPTTIAGMVDAAVGGKTGINAPTGKNLIGSFYSPKRVVTDLAFIDSLSTRDRAAGLAEVIKTGLIADRAILEILNGASGISALDQHWGELIRRSVSVKASVVGEDFKEGKLREVLNYGHTLGHAIEKREMYEMRHGEAVSIGLVFAAELSHLVCGLSREAVSMHREMLQKFNLPTTYDGGAFSELAALMQSDKKSRSGRLRFIGLSEIGHPEWLELIDMGVLQQAYERISS